MNQNYNLQKDVFVKQRAQQELFIKSNLDYENRLRGHMYQFEDENNKGSSIKKLNMNKGGKAGKDNNSNNDKNEIK